MVLGWLIVVSGVIEAVHAFRMRKWGGIFLHLVGGILGVLIGLLVVTHPVAGALAWTLLFAAFFTVIGIFRLVAAIRLKFPNWGWAAFDGTVTLLRDSALGGVALVVGSLVPRRGCGDLACLTRMGLYDVRGCPPQPASTKPTTTGSVIDRCG